MGLAVPGGLWTGLTMRVRPLRAAWAPPYDRSSTMASGAPFVPATITGGDIEAISPFHRAYYNGPDARQ